MKPKPLSSLNHFTVPVAILIPSRVRALRIAEGAAEATTAVTRGTTLLSFCSAEASVYLSVVRRGCLPRLGSGSSFGVVAGRVADAPDGAPRGWFDPSPVEASAESDASRVEVARREPWVAPAARPSDPLLQARASRSSAHCVVGRDV